MLVGSSVARDRGPTILGLPHYLTEQLLEESLFLAPRDEQEAIAEAFEREGALEVEPADVGVLERAKPSIIPEHFLGVFCDALWLCDRREDAYMWAVMRRDIDDSINEELRPVLVEMVGGADALESLDNVHDYPAILSRASTGGAR